LPSTIGTHPEPSLTDGESDVGVKQAGHAPFAAAPGLERLALIAAATFQIVILVVIVLANTVPYSGAHTVLLRVVPIDPRDLFRGDYVTLGYDISRVQGRSFPPGQTVYVSLEPDPDGRHYHATAFLTEPPPSGLYIQGSLQESGRVVYGIESYYVQAGTGHDYERAVREHRLSAEVALDARGRPALRRLVVE
jgi:uncharacterized membrane-anchored protein